MGVLVLKVGNWDDKKMRAGDKIEGQSGAKCRLCSQKWTKTKVCYTENSS